MLCGFLWLFKLAFCFICDVGISIQVCGIYLLNVLNYDMAMCRLHSCSLLVENFYPPNKVP